MQYIKIFSCCLLMSFLFACSEQKPTEEAETNKETTDSISTQAGRTQSTQKWDGSYELELSREIAGLNAGTRIQDMPKAVGEENISEASIYLYNDTLSGYKIYAGSPKELEVMYGAEEDGQEQYITSIQIKHPNSPWHTPEQIGVGTTVQEVEQINGKPFKMIGFMWPTAGSVMDWQGGELAHYQNSVALVFGPADGNRTAPIFSKPEAVWSNSVQLNDLDLQVKSIQLNIQ